MRDQKIRSFVGMHSNIMHTYAATAYEARIISLPAEPISLWVCLSAAIYHQLACGKYGVPLPFYWVYRLSCITRMFADTYI